MDDAALPAPRRRALPNELVPDRAGSRLSRDMVRAGVATGRSCSLLNREVRWLEFSRFSILCLALSASEDPAVR